MRYSDHLGIPATPLPPGMNPGGWLLEARYPDGTVELTQLGPSADNVTAIAERHGAAGATVVVYDGDTGEPYYAIGVLQ